MYGQNHQESDDETLEQMHNCQQTSNTSRIYKHDSPNLSYFSSMHVTSKDSKPVLTRLHAAGKQLPITAKLMCFVDWCCLTCH